MICLGAPVSAPYGYGSLSSERRYYFVGRIGNPDIVVLAFFEKPECVFLERFNGGEFERGLEGGLIQPEESCSDLPPWLEILRDGQNPGSMTLEDYLERHKERINERFSIIKPLLDRETEILSHKNPHSLIDRYARTEVPNVKKQRIRAWFFSYLCFGRTLAALLPNFIGCGRNRGPLSAIGPKLGTPSIHGNFSGYRPSEEMKKMIIEGYEDNSEGGKYLTKIHSDVLTKKFGCLARNLKDDKFEFYHPLGAPFPTYNQFCYRVYKHFGKQYVQEKLYGSVRFRNRKAASKGRYTQSVGYLLERVEADGYYVKEVPINRKTGEPLPPLCVVRIRDVLSGKIVGIGFSIGGEAAEAYQMALFSMAIKKQEFCMFYGIEISPEEWTSCGLPKWLSVDRGPGSIEQLIAGSNGLLPAVSMAPSYDPQSKSGIEQSHPRNVKTEGEPVYHTTTLGYVDLARREIFRAISDNHSSDMSAHVTRDMPEMIPSPKNLWNYYERGFRTHARHVSTEIAVRAFLPTFDFSIREDGAYIGFQRFDSEKLRATGICDRVVNQGRITAPGYLIPLTVRQAWIDVRGHLAAVQAMLEVRGDRNKLFLSLYDLQASNELLRGSQAQHLASRSAIRSHYEGRFEELTGQKWESCTTQKGQPKRNKAVNRAEVASLKNLTRGR